MTWARIDDNFPDHPKVIGLSDGAFRTFIESLCYCARNLTDGEVVTGAVRSLGGPKRFRELVAAGVMDELEGGGYSIHDYLDYNPSRESVERDRAQARERMTHARGNKRRSSPDVRPNITRSSDNPDPVPDPLPPEQEERARGKPTEADPAKALTTRLWAVHDELAGRIKPPSVSDEHEFEEWIAGGLTADEIEAAIESVRSWAVPPDKPWAAFMSALGSITARRKMGGNSDGRAQTAGDRNGAASRGRGSGAWPGPINGGRRADGRGGIPTAAIPKRASDVLPEFAGIDE